MMLLKIGKSHSKLAQLLPTSTTKFSLYAASYIENSHRSPQNGLFIAAYGSVRFVVDAETDF